MEFDAPAISVKKMAMAFITGRLMAISYWSTAKRSRRRVRTAPPDRMPCLPKLRINTETKEWEMSIDNGTTWTSMGVRAEGTDGDSMFESVDFFFYFFFLKNYNNNVCVCWFLVADHPESARRSRFSRLLYLSVIARFLRRWLCKSPAIWIWLRTSSSNCVTWSRESSGGLYQPS